MLVSVLIINLNGERHLAQLIAALQQQTLGEFEIIFVDNASTDHSISIFEELCQKFTLPYSVIANQQNVGFAPACSQGIASSQASWIALLNNDAFPEPTWLEYLYTTANATAGIGMVAAKLLFAHAPERINSAGIAIDWAGIAWDWRGGELDSPDETQPVEIFGPCGGAALYSHAMLDEIGGFDDDFFAYLEDVDLAWRGRLAGWRSLLEPKARVYHIHSATLGNDSPFKNYLLGRNKVWLIAKNYPLPWLLLYLPVILAYDLMSMIGSILRTRNFSPLLGRLAALRQLPLFLKKRRSIQKKWGHTNNWQMMMAPLVLPNSVLKRYAHLQ